MSALPKFDLPQTSLAHIVGTPTSLAWSQVHKFSPGDALKVLERGEFFVAISFAKSETQSLDVGSEILTRLNEEYYGSETFSQTPFSHLNAVILKVGQEFKLESLEIISAVIWGKFIYLSVFGSGKIYLFRDGIFNQILEGGQEVQIISGNHKVGDMYLLATNQFSRIVNSSKLMELFSTSKNIDEVADNIAPIIHSADSAQVAGALISIDSEVRENSDVSSRQIVSKIVETPKKLSIGINFNPRSFLVKLAEKLPERVDTKVYRFSPSGKKTAVSVGILLILLFCLSIGFGLKQKKENEYRLTYAESLSQIESLYSESLLVVDTDPTRASELFLEAKKIAGELEARGIKDKKFDSLKVKIKEGSSQILKEIESTTSTFLDLSLVRSGITAQEIVHHDGLIAVLDTEGQRVISTTDKKETTVIGGQDKLFAPRLMAIYAGRYFTFGEKGIIELDKKGAVSGELKPDNWGGLEKIGMYGGNLYLLDKDANQIWRYSALGSDFGFAPKKGWLASGITPDFSSVIDMAIDGSIWILHGSGAIIRYTGGAPQNFTVRGLEKNTGSFRAIYTDEVTENIYLLDTANSRIVELSKTGSFQKQYKSGEISQAVDFVVSKSLGKILLLVPGKILEIEL